MKTKGLPFSRLDLQQKGTLPGAPLFHVRQCPRKVASAAPRIYNFCRAQGFLNPSSE
jgi:hypothetical protein